MTVHPVRSTKSAFQLSSHRTRWAVGMAALVALGFLALAVAYAVDGTRATDTAWGHFLVAMALLAALCLSLAAFTMSAISKGQHERWRWLWLPLLVFPGLVLFVVLGERYWWQ